MNWRT